MTCHYGGLTGDYNSFNGYTSNVCGTWYQNKIADLTQKAQAGGRFGQIFQNMINEYSKCMSTGSSPQPHLWTSLILREPMTTTVELRRRSRLPLRWSLKMQEGEAREVHNQMERQRRNELKVAFDDLKVHLPEIATSDKASKQQILDKAVETCLT